MSHTCNASEQGSWKDSYRSTADSVESFEDSVDSDNSSTSSSSARQSANNQTPPIGCITTHSVSAVIRPEKKMPPIDPLQFVKIQKNELSKKAVEQIKLAEEVKITKEKIKEVEEEWQNNLMSWKSKRKLTKNNSEDDPFFLSRNTNRKTKTFSEILNEKARSGGRIGYNLHRYVADSELEEELTSNQQQPKDPTTHQNEGESKEIHYEPNQTETMSNDRLPTLEQPFDSTESNLNRLLKANNTDQYDEEINRNGLGEVLVLDTTLLEEFSVKSDSCDIEQSKQVNTNNGGHLINGLAETESNATLQETINAAPIESNQAFSIPTEMNSPQPEVDHSVNIDRIESNQSPNRAVDKNMSQSIGGHSNKVHVPIYDWKTSHNSKSPKLGNMAPIEEGTTVQHNSSFEVEDEEDEIDEEFERLRIDQERSFKAKLYAFENLAKQEEEAARKVIESSRLRQKNRAKLAAERSKSLGNIQLGTRTKANVSAVHSTSSASMTANNASVVNDSPKLNSINKSKQEKHSKSLQNLNSSECPSVASSFSNSTIYNFTEKGQKPLDVKSELAANERAELKLPSNSNSSSLPIATKAQPTESKPTLNQAQNIYENFTPVPVTQQQQQQPQQQTSLMSIDPVSESNAIRNASQKLLQQQQQIYQNQPLPTQYHHRPQQLYPASNNGNIAMQQVAPTTGNDHPAHPTDNILCDKVVNPVPIRGYPISDDVGLPPIQITKSNQSGSNMAYTAKVPAVVAAKPEEEHLYVNQNQLMLNSGTADHNYSQYEYQQNPTPYESYGQNIQYPEPNYENQALIQKRMEESGSVVYPPEHFVTQPMYPYTTGRPNQYLYYPKPYSAANSAVKPIPKQQQIIPPNVSRGIPLSQNSRYMSNGPNGPASVSYNKNHWLLQEAELRRQLETMESSSLRLKNPNVIQPNPKANGNSGGYLSVSGKKKCSNCMDELGKGCAAMVVESLSLYYHINCFRCSVCNVQLGNGTVGTDVRVRNNKLHCQNCYSNDEAGLKFSRV